MLKIKTACRTAGMASLLTATAFTGIRADEPTGYGALQTQRPPSGMTQTAAMKHKGHKMASKKGMTGQHGDHIPGGNAPVGIMADKSHPEGTIMMSYRYMRMTMSDMLRSGSEVSANEILNSNGYCGAHSSGNCRVVPQDMTGEMHMVGLMYAPTNKIDLMAMTAYQIKTMDVDVYHMASKAFLGSDEMENSGFGDLSAMVDKNRTPDGQDRSQSTDSGLP